MEPIKHICSDNPRSLHACLPSCNGACPRVPVQHCTFGLPTRSCQTISTHMYSASAQRSCRRAYPWQAPAQGGSFPKRTHHRFNPAAKRSLASALIRCPGASQGSFTASPEANTASLFNPSTQHITASHLRCLTPKPSHVVSEPALSPLATNLRLPLSSFRDF